METKAAKRIRSRLEDHPAIRDAIRAVRLTSPVSSCLFQPHRLSDAMLLQISRLLDWNLRDDTLPMHEYALFHRVMCKVLCPTLSEADWRKQLDVSG